jgi:hypothetical protein
MKPGFLQHKKKLRSNYTSMNIYERSVTNVKSQNWICRLKMVHPQQGQNFGIFITLRRDTSEMPVSWDNHFCFPGGDKFKSCMDVLGSFWYQNMLWLMSLPNSN